MAARPAVSGMSSEVTGVSRPSPLSGGRVAAALATPGTLASPETHAPATGTPAWRDRGGHGFWGQATRIELVTWPCAGRLSRRCDRDMPDLGPIHRRRLGRADAVPGMARRRVVAGHLRCVADDYHEYLNDAPASRHARLMATGADADHRPQAGPAERGRAGRAAGRAGPSTSPRSPSARAYARRLPPVWDLPHHQYRDTVVTVGGMAGAACAEWHLHAWDLARALGHGLPPGPPRGAAGGWQAGHAAPAAAGPGCRCRPAGPWRPRGRPGQRRAGGRAGAAGTGDPWHALLRAVGPTAPGRRPSGHRADLLTVEGMSLMAFDVEPCGRPTRRWPTATPTWTAPPAPRCPAGHRRHRRSLPAGLGNTGGAFPASARSTR